MNRSSLAACALALLASVPAPAAVAFQEAAPKSAPTSVDGPQLELGREKIKVEIDQGNRKIARVMLDSTGTKAAHVTAIQMKGTGVTIELVQNLVRKGVAIGAPLDVTIEPAAAVRLEFTIDTKDQALGQRGVLISIETDGHGGTPLELPVEWEVVEKSADTDPDAEPARPKREIRELITPGPPPQLTCDRYLNEFGTVMGGERVKTSFTLTNTGAGDLIIQKVSKQCHCTLPRLILPNGLVPKETLQRDEMVGTLKPGESATLECEIDTAGLAGINKKRISIFTNDLPRNPTELNLTLTVENPFDFTPASANFGQVRRGSKDERTIRMVSRDDVGQFALTGYELSGDPVIDIDWRNVHARAGKGEACAWELTLRVRDDAACKSYRGKVKLEVDHPRIHAVDLHYDITVLPDVDWMVDTKRSPETINLGVIRPGVNDTKSIFLENKNPALPYVPKEVHVESKLGAEPFEVTVTPIEEGLRYELKLKVAHAPKTKSFNGRIIILADHPTLPRLELNFSGAWGGTTAPATVPAKSPTGKGDGH